MKPTTPIVLLLLTCGACGADDSGSAGASGTGVSGSGGSTGSGVTSTVVVSELSEADRAQFCTWAMAEAQHYVANWSDGRLCTLLGGLFPNGTDLAPVREQCADLRDSCLMDPPTLLALDCGSLTTCNRTVGDVESYYRAYRLFDTAFATCETLEFDTYQGAGEPEVINVLPNCTLVGSIR